MPSAGSGATGASGCAVEYAGAGIDALDIETRMTVCNLSVEMGGRFGIVAPDAHAGLRARPPVRAQRRASGPAAAQWATLRSDDDAVFDREVCIDVSEVVPQVTWGTSPQDTIGIDARIPDPAAASDPAQRAARQAALDLHGPARRRCDRRHAGGLGVHRLVHQRAHLPTCGSRPRPCAAGARGERRARLDRGCRARSWSSARPRPKGWRRCSSTPASNGASRAARCAWRPTARPCHRPGAWCRPRTATSSAARAGCAHPSREPAARGRRGHRGLLLVDPRAMEARP